MNRLPKIRAHRWKICLKTSQVLAFPANLNLRLVLPQSISLSKFQNNFTAEFEDLLSYGILLQRFLWNFCGIPITSKKNFKKSMFGLLKLFLVRMVHVVRQGARSIDLFTLCLATIQKGFEKYDCCYNLRTKLTFEIPFPKTEVLRKSCCYKALTLWNSLESHRREISKGHWKVGFLRKYF